MLMFVLLPLAVAIVFGLGMAVLGLRRLAGSVAALAIGVESFDPGPATTPSRTGAMVPLTPTTWPLP